VTHDYLFSLVSVLHLRLQVDMQFDMSASVV